MVQSAKIADYSTRAPRGPRIRRVVLCALVAVLVAGCGKGDRDARSGAEELFERGTKSMNSGNFTNAIGYYEALEARYPFSNQAKQAQLNLIFCYYRNGERELAELLYERFA